MDNQALLLTEDMCYLMCGSLLGMLAPNCWMNNGFNQELEHEREYDWHELDQSVQTNLSLLNPQQKEMYTLIKASDDGNGGLFF